MSLFKELRDAYEKQMAENKAGFSAVYDKKIQDLQSKLAGERGSAAGAIQEMKEMRTRCPGILLTWSDVCETLGVRE